ncbi:hypothetical protein FHR93_000711 [Geodermatophilus sabuli]|nr:hypothetical protein [Geodermatophilus sabuli]
MAGVVRRATASRAGPHRTSGDVRYATAGRVH